MIYIKRITNADITRQIDLTKETASSFFAFDPDVVSQRSLVFLDESTNASYSGSIKKSGHSTTITGDIFSFVKQNCDFGDIVVFSSTRSNTQFRFHVIKRTDNEFSGYDHALKLFGSRSGAINETTHLIASIDNIFNNHDLTLPLQQIYYGAPGTGKSHGINEQTKGQSVIRTTFHPDSDYSTFVGAYKPTTKEVVLRDLSGHKVVEDGVELKEERIVYEFVEQAFLKAYIKAWKNLIFNNGQPQYLIIEEINRGNCAQIFGDLFQLLDRNSSGYSVYPIHADSDMRKHLRKAFARMDEPEKQIFMQDSDKQSINQLYNGMDVISEVLSGDILLLPNNLYIWATMNTSDQSLFPIDSAFKRRWDWKYVPISKKSANYKIEVKKEDGVYRYDWWEFLDRVNTAIGKATSSEDKKLGYFFCKASKKAAETDKEPSIITADTFVGKVVFYLWNDVFKDYEVGDAKFHYGEDDLSLLSTKLGEDEVKREFSSFFNEEGNAKHESVAKLLDDLKVKAESVD